MDCKSLTESLFAAIDGEPGPLILLRHFLKAREAFPEAGHEDLIRRVLPAALTTSDRLQKAREAGISFQTILDKTYPELLAAIADPPLAIFFRGSGRALNRPSVAIVGSRHPTDYGLATAARLSAELAGAGFTIVSGLARGIDGRAHAAALEAGGRTVAVLGTGVDRIYPPEHTALVARILAAEGTIVSEFPPGTPPKPFHFPIRNRIISGLAHATIVVEAQLRSGSLSTARHCLEQGRELFAVPGQINREESKGTNKLISEGQARLLTSIEDVLAELKPLLGQALEERRRLEVAITDPLAREIWEHLDAYEPTSFDELAAIMGCPPGTLLAKLTDLEVDELIETRPGQSYLRNPLR